MPVGLTTASEFGGLNVSVTKLNGVTHNPWRHGRTAGGSSAGSAAAVAGGLVTLATGGDGGGSIRIPAGYTGLFGMKGTYGRIPRGPDAWFRPGTVVLGCLARSVRDAARYFDVCAGYDPLDPTSLPKRRGWEAGLGTNDLAGRRVAVVPALGGRRARARRRGRTCATSAAALIAATGMVEVDLRIDVPNLAAQWMMGNLATLLADLGDRWPACAPDLTDEIAIGLLLSQSMYNLHTAAVAEEQRIQANEAMAAAFEEVDFIIAATNPGPAFPADAAMSSPSDSFIDWAKSNPVGPPRLPRRARRGARASRPRSRSCRRVLLDRVAERLSRPRAHGRPHDDLEHLRQPAVSIPAGFVDGLPGRHAGARAPPRRRAAVRRRGSVERDAPWPLVAGLDAQHAARR